MSPRSTHALHEPGDLKHLAPVVFIGLELGNLSSDSGSAPQAAGAVEDRFADGL